MEYNLKKDIEFLKTIRDMNDEQVSNFLGISRMTLNRWMNNKSKPSKDSLEKIYNKIYEENIELSRIKENTQATTNSQSSKVPFRPKSNRAVIDLMNEGNNETGTQEKKGTFVDNDDSLEALPTIGNGCSRSSLYQRN